MLQLVSTHYKGETCIKPQFQASDMNVKKTNIKRIDAAKESDRKGTWAYYSFHIQELG